MKTTAKVNRTDLSSGKTNRAILASVFTAMLMAAASVHVVGAENPHEQASSPTKPACAAIARTNTDTNLVLLLQEARPDSHLSHGRV